MIHGNGLVVVLLTQLEMNLVHLEFVILPLLSDPQGASAACSQGYR
ncbi:MAG TPA: hypothetical protein VEK55_17295 [Xanthobacteraceae bacterium]|nr:hypothetical protein [Xanthobacteraceae bacterium]